MSQRGFLILPRNWDRHAALQIGSYDRRSAFLWLVRRAVYHPHEFDIHGKTVELQPGQLCASLDELAKAWTWSKSKVRCLLSRLEVDNVISTDISMGRHVITICNYREFQAGMTPSSTGANTSMTQQQHTGDIQKKKDKKTKNEKEFEILSRQPKCVMEGNASDTKIKASSERSPKAEAALEIKSAIEQWNEMAARQGLSLVSFLSQGRKDKMTRTLMTIGGLSGWAQVLSGISSSKFLLGNNNTSWTVDFDWVVNESNAARIIERARRPSSNKPTAIEVDPASASSYASTWMVRGADSPVIDGTVYGEVGE